MCLLFVNAVSYATAKVQPLDQVVAVVNDEVITQSQLDKAVITAKKELKASNTPVPAQKTLEKQVLNQLIDRNIELQMAKRFGLEVTQADLNKAISDVAKRNHASMSQLKNMVESNGVSWKDYRQQIKDQLIIQKVLGEAVGSRIQITDQEIKNVMDSPEYQNKKISEYRVSDILISLPDEPSSAQLHQADKTADQILAELKKGVSFKQLAAANSSSNTALSGGDLGWRSLEELPTVFANKLETMKVGEVAGPIRTGNGLHVIKLVDVKSKQNKHYITETNVRHILIKVKVPSESAEAKKQAEKIRAQLVHGASFSQLAKAYSQDPGSASKGGSLGWVPPGVLVPPFENAMNHLKINTISQPVKTSYGWHIIEVLGRKKVDDTADYQKNEIRKMIYQRRFQEEAQNWVERMKDASYIKVYLNTNG